MDSQLEGRGFDSRPFYFHVTTLGKLFTQLHTHVPSSTSSIISTDQKSVMPYGWEGNRRSGVVLAMRGLFIYGLSGLVRDMSLC